MDLTAVLQGTQTVKRPGHPASNRPQGPTPKGSGASGSQEPHGAVKDGKGDAAVTYVQAVAEGLLCAASSSEGPRAVIERCFAYTSEAELAAWARLVERSG